MTINTINTLFTALECLVVGGATVFGCALLTCIALRCWVRREGMDL